jgi:hypothetical protein
MHISSWEPGVRETIGKIAIIGGTVGGVKRRAGRVDYHRPVAPLVRYVLVILLGLEVLNTLLWAARIAAYAGAYDATVLAMVLLRVAVATLQAAAAWMLAGRALPGVLFARWGLASSAILLIPEMGLRLSPSSIPPGARLPAIVVYAVYAAVAISWLRVVRQQDERA